MPEQQPTNTRLKSYIYLLINTVCWGAALVIVKPALEFTTPFRFLFYRYLLASIFSLPLLLRLWPKVKHSWKSIKRIVILETLGMTVALSLLYSGLGHTSAIEASLLASTTTVFTVIAGIIYLKEKEETHEWLGLIFAFFGTMMLTAIPLLNGVLGLTRISFLGNILVIGHNLSTAIYFVLAKKHYRKIPKMYIAILSFYLGTISFLPLSLIETGFSPTGLWQSILADFQQSSVWLASLYMAIFGSIIGFTAYLKGQDKIEASEASLFWYLQPLIYIPLGMLWLKESINYLQILAIMIIFVGVVIAEKRFHKEEVK